MVIFGYIENLYILPVNLRQCYTLLINKIESNKYTFIFEAHWLSTMKNLHSCK